MISKNQRLIDKNKEKTSTRYAVKDGFHKMLRNPFIFLASVSTMTLMLLVTSIFVIFASNAQSIINAAGEQPPVEIQFSRDASPGDVRALDRLLGDDINVLEHKVFSPEENFADFKEKMGKSELFDDFDYQLYIPYTIRLRLDSPAKGEFFKEEMLQYSGVRDVLMEEELMDFLNSSMQKFGAGAAAVFLALAAITIFIISTMVRVAALSRAEEIKIMKHLGATDKFISIPFVIEGLSVGFFSALIAGGASLLLYGSILRSLGGSLGNAGILNPLSIMKLLPAVLILCFGIGLSIGGLSSALSIRKYVKV